MAMYTHYPAEIALSCPFFYCVMLCFQLIIRSMPL